MSTETEAKLEKIQRYSGTLRRLAQLLFGVVALAAAASVVLLLVAGGEQASFNIGGVQYRGDAIPAAGRVVGIIGALIGFTVVLKLLYHLITLFGLYARGRLFTAENVGQIRQIGISVLLLTLIWIYELVAQLVLNAYAPPVSAGETATASMSVNVGVPISTVTCGIIILMVSWIMDVGRELREEQDLVV